MLLSYLKRLLCGASEPPVKPPTRTYRTRVTRSRSQDIPGIPVYAPGEKRPPGLVSKDDLINVLGRHHKSTIYRWFRLYPLTPDAYHAQSSGGSRAELYRRRRAKIWLRKRLADSAVVTRRLGDWSQRFDAYVPEEEA